MVSLLYLKNAFDLSDEELVQRWSPGMEIIHRGRYKTLTTQQRRWLERRRAIEPLIGHTKADHRMSRCRLADALGDALHALKPCRWVQHPLACCGPSRVVV